MWISRKVYEDLQKGHLRTVEALAEQIEYLRTQLGMPTPKPPLNPTDQPMAMVGQDLYVGEDEETLLEAHAAGLIEGEEFQKAMEQVGLINKEVQVQVLRGPDPDGPERY